MRPGIEDRQERGALYPPQTIGVDAAKEHQDAHDRQGTEDENDESHGAANELSQDDLAVLQLGREQQVQGALFAFAGDDAAEKERHKQEDRPILHAADGMKQRLGEVGHDANGHGAALKTPAILLPDNKEGEEEDQAVEHAVKVVALAARHLHHFLGEDRSQQRRQKTKHGVSSREPITHGLL